MAGVIAATQYVGISAGSIPGQIESAQDRTRDLAADWSGDTHTHTNQEHRHMEDNRSKHMQDGMSEQKRERMQMNVKIEMSRGIQDRMSEDMLERMSAYHHMNIFIYL